MSDSEVLRALLIGTAIKHVAGDDISSDEVEKLWKEAKEEIRTDPEKCRKEVKEWRETIREEDPFLDWFCTVYECL